MNTCCKILYKEIAYEAYIKSKRDSFMMQKKKKKTCDKPSLDAFSNA